MNEENETPHSKHSPPNTESRISSFKIPIYYNDQRKTLKSSVLQDLELTQNIDTDSTLMSNTDASSSISTIKPIYHYVFNLPAIPKTGMTKTGETETPGSHPEEEYHSHIIEQSAQYYTTDRSFLKDTQKLLTHYTSYSSSESYENMTKTHVSLPKVNTIIETWREIRNDNGFKEKYYYIDWPMWEFLNKSDFFLQIMSVYNISSPILSLLLPIFILIVPFFIIQFRGVSITMNEYIEVLKIIASNHAFGKLFTEFDGVSLNQKMYLIISAGFYVFSIYQNLLMCIRFHMNMIKMHKNIQDFRCYMEYTISKMKHYVSLSSSLPTYIHFNQELYEKIRWMEEKLRQLKHIRPYEFSIRNPSSFNKVFEIGYVLKCFYEIYDCSEYDEMMNYSFGFHSYITCLEGLRENVQHQQMNFAEFLSSPFVPTADPESCEDKTHENKEKEKIRKKELKKKLKNKKGIQTESATTTTTTAPKLTQSYYAVLKDEAPVKNDVDLNTNMIITGPNAAGKTTVLKSTLINLLLSQQFGCGFYEKARFYPYSHFHCYLNIPDTSGRDSLFQAEAKRCKEILDIVERSQTTTSETEGGRGANHFCVFDEIYSGTNPEEATLSTVAFIRYLVKHPNVSCMLTTHFIQSCKKLGKNKKITNYHMEVNQPGSGEKCREKKGRIIPTYLLKKGISEVKGGIQILRDMNYPLSFEDE